LIYVKVRNAIRNTASVATDLQWAASADLLPYRSVLSFGLELQLSAKYFPKL